LMTSGPLPPLGDIAASTPESNDHASTLGEIQTANVLPAGHEKRFLSRIKASSCRPDERTPVTGACACIVLGKPANFGMSPVRARVLPRNTRRSIFLVIKSPKQNVRIVEKRYKLIRLFRRCQLKISKSKRFVLYQFVSDC